MARRRAQETSTGVEPSAPTRPRRPRTARSRPSPPPPEGTWRYDLFGWLHLGCLVASVPLGFIIFVAVIYIGIPAAAAWVTPHLTNRGGAAVLGIVALLLAGRLAYVPTRRRDPIPTGEMVKLVIWIAGATIVGIGSLVLAFGPGLGEAF